MSNTFEFNKVRFSIKVQESQSCAGCYFRNQPVYLCNEQQNSKLVPMCHDEHESYIFIEIKDNA